MSALDEALQKFIEDPEKGQEPYYEELLNTEFYIPLAEAPEGEQPENVVPMVLESDEKKYMMLFDSIERLTDWADEEAAYAIYAGYQLAELAPVDLHWAVNVGTDLAKELVPDEIGWLKQAVVAYREQEEGSLK